MRKNKQRRARLSVAVFLVAVFAVFQAMEYGNADTDQVNVTTSVQGEMTFSCGSTVALGNITAGTPATGSVTCTTTTNNATGYTLAIKNDNSPTLSDGAGTTIADKTAWNSTTPNSAVWGGTGLGFRVAKTGTTAIHSDTWWGADDTLANALYAGLPTSYQNILNQSAYSAGSTDTIVAMKLDVPSTQKTGNYSGTVTVQTTVNP